MTQATKSVNQVETKSSSKKPAARKVNGAILRSPTTPGCRDLLPGEARKKKKAAKRLSEFKAALRNIGLDVENGTFLPEVGR
jgi:hypothetical protein